MIRRRYLRPGVLAAVLYGFVPACFAVAATAPATTALHAPAGQWAVGPISAKSANGTSYCSMKNAFAGGQTLVFARDNQGSNSIALDFHKDMFEISRQYNVKVTAGSVTRRIVALAATKQVLVMQTGVDSIFYGAVRSRHSITFNVEKNDYGFNLDVSVADALSALGHCTESFQNGAAFAQAKFPLGKTSVAASGQPAEEEPPAEEPAQEASEEPAPPPKRHGHNKKSVASKKQQTQSEIEALQDQNRNLQLENEKIQQELASRNQPAAPAPEESPASSARDEVKAEITAEILRMRANEVKEKAAPSYTPAPALAMAAPVPLVSKAVPAPPPAVAAPVVVKRQAEDMDLKHLLVSSRIVSGRQISVGAGNTLRWTSDDLYGSAQELPMASGASLTEMANSYLQKTASLCKGDFAKNTGPLKRAGKLDIIESEITCLDGRNDAAAAVLFVSANGKFSVITQEGTADQLDTAMSDRDAIVSAAINKAND